MKINILIKIIVGLSICLILYFLYKSNLKKNKIYFKKVELIKENKINNSTDAEYLDTIILVGLQKLSIKNIKVYVFPLKKTQVNVAGSNIDLNAHIKNIGNFYYIWIKPMNKLEYIQVLSHELIHLQQYYNKEIVINENVLIWKNTKYDLNTIPYESRPWEIDAYRKENYLKNLIIDDLY
jgi:hypothetical protein